MKNNILNIICPIPKIKTLELLDIFFASNFEKICNLHAKTTKNLPRQKLKGQDMLLEEKKKISEISEFSILPYTQNGKLRNLLKCSFTSNFVSSCNLRLRKYKNELRQKPKGEDVFKLDKTYFHCGVYSLE